MPTQTIRFYERKGLLPPAQRGANGYRDYDASALTRLQFIRSGQAAGLALVEIASILALRERAPFVRARPSLLLGSERTSGGGNVSSPPWKQSSTSSSVAANDSTLRTAATIRSATSSRRRGRFSTCGAHSSSQCSLSQRGTGDPTDGGCRSTALQLFRLVLVSPTRLSAFRWWLP